MMLMMSKTTIIFKKNYLIIEFMVTYVQTLHHIIIMKNYYSKRMK